MIVFFCILVALIVFGLADILFDICTFRVVRYKERDSKLNAPFSFVVLSDLHGWNFGKNNKRLIRAIHKLSPDAVLIAGDLLTSNRHCRPDKIAIFLKELSASYPVFYGMGNHEEKLNRRDFYYRHCFSKFRSLLKGSGVTFLINESIYLEKFNVRIHGLMLGNEYFERFYNRPLKKSYLERRIGSVDRNAANILIAHNPEYFSDYANWGKSLVLSGHNHGGIIGIPFLGGLISPKFTFFPKYDGGRFVEGDSVMLLSRGLGTHTIPVRMFNRAELLYVCMDKE